MHTVSIPHMMTFH